ncbi:hypothetical protein PAXRUDRAFT_829812 [Paxillus rubicundulus Ve08.2h10]|uniref:Uncharacterized protein n=1 Tax=Paxillus rubicundulus Ve08.2h10 TaxID=930991 RepID=A0A0D0E568_9AGAM|nr:hypothetical protein PAXRUDRAFT_829812 [Paxillus rubicundulus Ve08.2h10]
MAVHIVKKSSLDYQTKCSVKHLLCCVWLLKMAVLYWSEPASTRYRTRPSYRL